MLSRLGHSFSSKEQASFNFMAAVTICSDFGAPQIKSLTIFTVSPSICHEVMELDAMTLVFWMLSFKTTFSLSSFIFINRLFSSSSLSALRVVSSVYLRLFIFLPQSWFQLVWLSYTYIFSFIFFSIMVHGLSHTVEYSSLYYAYSFFLKNFLFFTYVPQ